MLFQLLNNSDILINTVQIILCAVIIGFFIKNRILARKYGKVKEKKILTAFFESPFYNIAIQEQIKQTFNNIVQTISNERNGLERMVGIKRLSEEVSNNRVVHPEHKLLLNKESQSIPEESTGATSRCDTVIKLSEKGLKSKKISEDLQIAIDEVELILSLHKI